MKNEILTFSELKKRKSRRETINSAMSDLMAEGKDCNHCVGHCCTFEHNSMQVTPLEALDVYACLEEDGRITDELVEHLEENITHYRLDKDPASIGKKSFRRYYTCPFYQDRALGCSLDRDSKPYGCLAFNPNSKLVSTPGYCTSNNDVLMLQNNTFGNKEELDNQFLRDKLGIYWNKMNLPNALLILIKKLNKI